MSTTKFKPGDLVRIKSEIMNQEGVVQGDIVEVAENISNSPQDFTSIIMPSGKALSWFNDRFEKIDSWTNTTSGLQEYKYYVKAGRVRAKLRGRDWVTGLLVSDLTSERERFVKNPAVEVSEHGFTVGQRLYTTNSQWPEIDFVGEFTFNGKPYVKGIHSRWGTEGTFPLYEVFMTKPLADWEKELLRALPQGDPDALKQESEAPFAREGVIYRSRSTGMDYKIREGKLYFGRRWGINSHDYVLKDVTPENFTIVDEPETAVAEELPPVSRKHFDESRAAGERRRQKLITHVEELQAKLSEKNKVRSHSRKSYCEAFAIWSCR